MKSNSFYYLLFLFFAISFTSCINKDNLKQKERKAENQAFKKVEIKYASGFSVDYFDGGKIVKVYHPKNGEELDRFLLLVKEDSQIPEEYKNAKRFKLPLKEVVCQSTTHVSYLDQLNELSSLKGIAYGSWMKNANAKAMFEKGEISEINNGLNLNKELLIDLSPELMFMYPFDQSAVENIKEHLPIILTTEYLEDHPLSKLEWLKFFALFYNQEERADSIFQKVRSAYEELKNQPVLEADYFMNLPYQGNWNCPPGNSYSVHLLKDVGMNYIYAAELQDANLKKTKEEIIDQCLSIPYWIIIAQREVGFDLADLKKEDPIYSEFEAVKKGNVIFCNTVESDYFGDALIEPDILLENLKEVLSGRSDSTKYFSRLK